MARALGCGTFSLLSSSSGLSSPSIHEMLQCPSILGTLSFGLSCRHYFLVRPLLDQGCMSSKVVLELLETIRVWPQSHWSTSRNVVAPIVHFARAGHWIQTEPRPSMDDRKQGFELFPDRPTDRLQVLAKIGPQTLPEPDPAQVPNQFPPASLDEPFSSRR